MNEIACKRCSPAVKEECRKKENEQYESSDPPIFLQRAQWTSAKMYNWPWISCDTVATRPSDDSRSILQAFASPWRQKHNSFGIFRDDQESNDTVLVMSDH